MSIEVDEKYRLLPLPYGAECWSSLEERQNVSWWVRAMHAYGYVIVFDGGPPRVRDPALRNYAIMLARGFGARWIIPRAVSAAEGWIERYHAMTPHAGEAYTRFLRWVDRVYPMPGPELSLLRRQLDPFSGEMKVLLSKELAELAEQSRRDEQAVEKVLEEANAKRPSIPSSASDLSWIPPMPGETV